MMKVSKGAPAANVLCMLLVLKRDVWDALFRDGQMRCKLDSDIISQAPISMPSPAGRLDCLEIEKA